MSTLATALAVIYFVAILACLYLALHSLYRALQFLLFPYPRPPTVSSSVRMRNSQWRRFLSQISVGGAKPNNEFDSDSNNELNAQKKVLSPTSFVDWLKCLFVRYHPAGTAVYRYRQGAQGEQMPISATVSLVLTACSHWLVTVLYVLVLYWDDSEASPLELSQWLPIAVPCSVAITLCGYAGTVLARRAVRSRVTTLLASTRAPHGMVPRKESSAELFLRGGDQSHDRICPAGRTAVIDSSQQKSFDRSQLSELDPSGAKEDTADSGAAEGRIRLGLLCTSVVVAVCVGFTISSANTLTSTAVSNYLITFAISWGMDLTLLRTGFILLLALVFSRSKNMVTDCGELAAFELWAIPEEVPCAEDASVSPNAKPHVEPDTQLASVCSNAMLGLKDSHPSESKPFEPNAGEGTEISHPDFTLDTAAVTSNTNRGTEKPAAAAPGEERKDRLETVRDDVEGENMASIASPPRRTRIPPANQAESKENSSNVDARARMLWGFHDVVSSKQTSPLVTQRPQNGGSPAGNKLSPDKPVPGEMSFAAPDCQKYYYSPNTRVAMIYGSPTKCAARVHRHEKESPAKGCKTSPKRKRRTFAYDGDSVYEKSPNRMEDQDPELRELIKSIRDAADLCANQPITNAKSPLPPIEEVKPEEKAGPEMKEEDNSILVIQANDEGELSEGEGQKEIHRESVVEPQNALQIQPANLDSRIREEKKATNQPCHAENIEESNSGANRESLLLFQKRDENAGEMRKLDLFGRMSVTSNKSAGNRLLLESIADLKAKLQSKDKPNLPAPEPDKKPTTKEAILDVSDFDANIENDAMAAAATIPQPDEPAHVERGSSAGGSMRSTARSQRTALVWQKGRLARWLQLAEAHDRPVEAEKLRELLARLRATKKPLKKAEMSEFEMLEVFELPYSVPGNMPIARPISNDKSSEKSSARSKSRGRMKDPAKLNELYMVYSNNRPKHLNAVETGGKHCAGGKNPEEPLVMPSTIEVKRQLPPLKMKALVAGGKKSAEPSRDELGGEFANNKHLAKIDQIIGQCFDKVRKSFGKVKPRQSSKNIEEFIKDGTGMALAEYQNEHKVRIPRRSLSRVDAQ